MATVTPSIKSITLAPGDCFVLPKDAVVTSIVTSGAISVSSDCATLPAPTTYKCGVFYFFIDETGTDDSAMEEEYVTYTKLTVGGTSFTMNLLANSTSETDMNLSITDQALIKIMAIQRNVLTDRQRFGVYFQTPSDLFSTVVLQISDRGTVYNLPPYEATCEEYPIPA
jgi:hypothetical protein